MGESVDCPFIKNEYFLINYFPVHKSITYMRVIFFIKIIYKNY